MKNIFFSGSIFLFAIIIILCLTSFAVLAYDSANNDLKLAEKNEEYVTAYYDADKRAVEIISRIDETLIESRINVKTQEDYLNSIHNRITEYEYYLDMEDDILSFNVKVNERQKLSVKIKILDYKEKKRYKIISYRLVQGNIWQEESTEDNIKGMWRGQ